MLCVAANLGPGLRYDSVTGDLAVRLSGDAGNAASFGSDLGIYVPGGDTNPDPASGRKTIAGLPARAFGATQGGAGAMVPFASPHSIEYGVANRMDVISFHTFNLADGVALNRWGITPTSQLNVRTDNPSSMPVDLISSLTLPSLNVDAGTRVNPTGRNSGAPSSLLSPDGGWYGYYADPFIPQTLAESLWHLAARAVAYLAVFGGFDGAGTPGRVAAAIRTVAQVGSQAWTIIGISPYIDDGGGNIIVGPFADWVADVAGAGMTAAVDLFEDVAGGFAVTPAQVVASGAEWVRLRAPEEAGGGSYERVTAFADAGLQVIVQTTSRHWDTQLAYDAGARVVMADSPVYARGGRGEAGDLDYRKTTVIPGLISRTQVEGALTRETDNGFGLADVGWPRQSASGRYFSAGFGRVGGVGARLTSQLLGELCPYEVTASHRIRVRMRVDPTQSTLPSGTVPKIGLFVAAPTDRNITTFVDSADEDLPPWVNGYWCFVRVGVNDRGQVVLGKVTDGVYSVLDDSDAFTVINIGSWINMSVTLNTGNVTLAVGHAGETVSYDVADTDHRGPYVYYGWEDDFLPPITNAGFAHGYSAYELYATTSPMYENLAGGA